MIDMRVNMHVFFACAHDAMMIDHRMIDTQPCSQRRNARIANAHLDRGCMKTLALVDARNGMVLFSGCIHVNADH